MKFHKRIQKAFSLIEVTMALGVMTFALVPIIGLLSMGLKSSRESQDRSIENQIVEWSYGKAKAASAVENLTSFLSGGPYYFDSEGQPLPSSAGSNERLFSADLAPTNVTLPGSPESIPGVLVTIKSPAKNNQLVGSHAFWLDQ